MTLSIIWIVIITNGMVVALRLVQVAGWKPEKMVDEISSWSQAMLFLESYNPHEMHFLARYSILALGFITGINTVLLKSANKSMLVISTLTMVSHLKKLERKAETMNACEV